MGRTVWGTILFALVASASAVGCHALTVWGFGWHDAKFGGPWDNFLLFLDLDLAFAASTTAGYALATAARAGLGALPAPRHHAAATAVLAPAAALAWYSGAMPALSVPIVMIAAALTGTSPSVPLFAGIVALFAAALTAVVQGAAARLDRAPVVRVEIDRVGEDLLRSSPSTTRLRHSLRATRSVAGGA